MQIMLLKDHVFVKPPVLPFKYAGSWVEKFFEDPHLRFSSPAVFNDPFDFFPTINLKINRQQRLNICRHKHPTEYRLTMHSETGEEINWPEKIQKISEEKERTPQESWYQKTAEARRAKYGS